MFRSKKKAKMTICTMFSLSLSINKRINPKEFILGKIRLPLSSFMEVENKKNAKDVGVDRIDKRKENNLQYCQSTNLLAIVGSNERLVDLLRLVISIK